METSESSFSSEADNMSFSQQQQYDNELTMENEILMDLQQQVLDIMEDFTADSVKVGNLQLVNSEM